MTKLLQMLATELVFFLDPHRYVIVGSGGSANGDAYVDLQRGDLVWRLATGRSELSLELRLQADRDYPAYSTDILKRWTSGERDDDAARLTPEIAVWVAQNLSRI